MVPNRWAGWNVLDCPTKLDVEKSLLINHLAGLALIAKTKRDRRGWGRHTGSYSTSEGYQIGVSNIHSEL